LLLARQSLERSRRHAPQIHLPRPRRQRAALRFIERPTRAARSLRRSRRRTHPPPVAISHDRALFAAGRPLGERWQTRRARERPRPLPKLSRVTQASLPAIFRDASREFLLAWFNQCEPVSVIITRSHAQDTFGSVGRRGADRRLPDMGSLCTRARQTRRTRRCCTRSLRDPGSWIGSALAF